MKKQLETLRQRSDQNEKDLKSEIARLTKRLQDEEQNLKQVKAAAQDRENKLNEEINRLRNEIRSLKEQIEQLTANSGNMV